MRIVIIGAVAGGTSAGAKARRNDDFAEIIIYEKDRDISYSGCGLPYYIGGEVEDLEELTPRDAAFFKEKYNINVKTEHEVVEIIPGKKLLKIKKLSTGEIFEDSYDTLLLSTGAIPFLPPVEGIEKEHVFFLRTVQNAREIKKYITEKKPKTAVIAGTGFIGFEVMENLMMQNIQVTLVEVAAKITPNLDEDMALFLENELVKRGVNLLKSTGITAIRESKVELSDGEILPADLVIMATGVRPNTALAKHAGITLGKSGGIQVNERMQTNLENIYACGDCIETFSVITGKPVYRPLGSTANKTGRIAGDSMTGGDLTYKGNLGTGIFKVLDLAVGSTGFSEKDACGEGYDVEVSHNIKMDKPDYFHGEEMVIKAIADRKTKRLLGVQIIGTKGVDKRLDVFATLITYKATVDELFHLDLAYSPPFSTTKDPVHYTGMILDNAISRGRKLITRSELEKRDVELQIIDTRSGSDFTTKGHIQGAINLPHGELRNKLGSLDPEKPTVTYCNKGVTGNAVQNILLSRGFKKVYNLSGGHKFFSGIEKKEE